MVINRRIGQSMVEQLERVNKPADPTPQTLVKTIPFGLGTPLASLPGDDEPTPLGYNPAADRPATPRGTGTPMPLHAIAPPVAPMPPARHADPILVNRQQAAEIIRLKHIIDDLRAQLEDQQTVGANQGRQAACPPAAIDHPANTAPTGMTINGRPVITQRQAAAIARRSVAQVSRYCTTGHWEHTEPDAAGHIWIYKDQDLSPKHRKTKKG